MTKIKKSIDLRVGDNLDGAIVVIAPTLYRRFLRRRVRYTVRIGSVCNSQSGRPGHYMLVRS